MNELAVLLSALAAGALLGAFFFAGLWLTVSRGIPSGKPAMWFLLSLVFRVSIVLAGFFMVSGGQFYRLLACLAGFIAARMLLSRLSGTWKKQPLLNKFDRHGYKP